MLDEEIFYIFLFQYIDRACGYAYNEKKEKYYIYGSEFPGARNSPGSREYIRQIQSGRVI